MVSDETRQAICEEYDGECVICGRCPEEWLETDRGRRTQEKLSIHHVNGDDEDDRLENLIPLCQSCHVHVHKVDRPPYRKWHRQLPLEHRNAWNQYYKEYYEGPRITREEAEQRYNDDDGTPESVKYRKHERPDEDTNSDDHDADDDVENDGDDDMEDEESEWS